MQRGTQQEWCGRAAPADFAMNRITFFTKPDCTLCDGALFVIEKLRHKLSFALETIDISAPGHEKWFDAYKHDIPVVHLNGKEIFRHQINERALRLLLTGPDPPSLDNLPQSEDDRDRPRWNRP